MLRRKTVLAAVGAAVLVGAAAAMAAIAPIKEYTVPLTSEYTIKKIISAGDTVPETSDPTKQYQMVGIPDGLGAHGNPDGTTTVFMNHELPAATLSEPVLGDPINRGAIVSKLTIDANGNVLSGERAYDWVFHENVFHGPASEVGNDTRAFSRFCSGALVGPAEGFDRYIYMTNEEEGTPANSHDGLGGLTVAIVENASTPCRSSAASPGRTRSFSRKRATHGDHVDGRRARRPRSCGREQPALHVRRQETAPRPVRASWPATASTTASCTSSARWMRPRTASSRSRTAPLPGSGWRSPEPSSWTRRSSRPPATPSAR